MQGSPGRRPTWIRGDARVVRGWAILDASSATEYVPTYDPDRLGEFVVIDSPRDVTRFASRFGLLREGPGSELREPVSLWWDEVALARGALEVQIDLMAVRGGAVGDAARFRENWSALLPDLESSVDDADLIADAKATVIAAVNRGLAGAALEISADNEPSRGYSVSPQFPDLLACIYSISRWSSSRSSLWPGASSAEARSSSTTAGRGTAPSATAGGRATGASTSGVGASTPSTPEALRVRSASRPMARAGTLWS